MSAEGTNEIYIFSLHEMAYSRQTLFTTNIWIFFLLYTSLLIEEMQILHLQVEVWHAVLSLGGDI